MLLPILLAILGLSGKANAQVGCDGSDIPQAAGLRAQYPPPFTVAQILPGDTEARNIYNAILATNNPALNYPPSSAPGGTLSTAGYDAVSDPHCWWSSGTRCDTPKAPGLLPDYWVCPQPRTWGYTLDDGPTCYHGEIYELMAQQNQLASLYYIGTNVIQWPLEAQRGYLAGHEICVHTWSHQYTTSLTNEQVFAELYYTKKLIKQVTGASVRCWRPPYGDLDDRTRVFATALDMRAHIWNQDTSDWEIVAQGTATVQQNYRNIIATDTSQQGIVVLAHEVNPQTCALAVQEYPNIRRAFPNIMPVSSCNNDPVIFGESGLPALPVFGNYNSGQRGSNRTSANFWTTDGLVFLNGTAANRGTTSSAIPSTTSATTIQPATTRTGTLMPSLQVSPVNKAAQKSSATSLQLSALFTLLSSGLLAMLLA